MQFNWIPLAKSADVMDLLASVNMHGIQTSGNCIRNITSDELAGIAADEIADPRPFAEIMRQWSTLHPEFAFLPRKFKIAITGATRRPRRHRLARRGPAPAAQRRRASSASRCWWAAAWAARRSSAARIREFLPWNQILNYLEAVVRVYNRWGRRDNMYKARIKILVKAEGQRFIDEVEAEYRRSDHDGAPHTITAGRAGPRVRIFRAASPGCNAQAADAKIAVAELAAEDASEYQPLAQAKRGAAQEPRPARRHAVVQAPGPGPGRRHRRPARHRRRPGRPVQRRRSARHARPEPAAALGARRRPARAVARRPPRRPGQAQHPPADRHDRLPRRRLLRAGQCPLASRWPQAITERYQDMDELHDLGEIDLHISGCINSCGHHHSGHIGILGVDKDGRSGTRCRSAAPTART